MSTKPKSMKTEMASDDSIVQIPIEKLEEFGNHVFKPYKDKKMDQLKESIKENGIMQPIIVRKTSIPDVFEIISGHNRRKAAVLAGLKKFRLLYVS